MFAKVAADRSVNRTLLLIAPSSLAVTDGALTLAGQTSEFWSGDYQQVREHNPLASLILQAHPVWFALGILAWVIAFGLATHFLSDRLAVAISALITLGHTIGCSTWILQWRNGLVWVIVFLVLARMIASPIIDHRLLRGWPTNEKSRAFG